MTAAFLPGVLLGSTFPGHLPEAGLLVAAGFVMIARIMKKGQSSAFFPIILFFLLGYLSIQPWVSPRISARHISRFADGKLYELTGIVDELPRVSGRRTRLILEAETIGRGEAVQAVRGRIRISAARMDALPQKGDEVILETKIRPTHNFNNPGGFDYERFMAFKGIRVTGYARRGEIRVPAGGLERDGIHPLRRLRSRVAGVIASLPLEGGERAMQVKALLNALLIGDRNGLTPALRDLFSRSGTSHLLAISGLHIGIVAGAAFLVFKWILSFCRPLLRIGRVKTAAAILAFLPALGYGLVAGMSPSTQRAVVMVAVFLLTFIADRDQDLFNTLAVAALVIIAIHPPTLFSVSFQLSFAAVLAIVYGFGRLMPAGGHQDGFLPRLFRRIVTLFMVSLFATAGTLPLVMRTFNQVSLVGPLVNVLAVPLIGFIVVPVGLLAVLTATVFPPAAVWGLTACAHVLAAAVQIIEYSAALPFAAVKTVTPSVLEIVCYYVLLWGVVALASGKDKPFKSAPEWRRVQAAVLAACILISADVAYWVHERYLSRDLRVTILDVGQGSAALLELPRGYNILVDGGGFSDNTVFDVGARIVAPYLWRRKIRTIDAVVLSHPNSDHLNGLTYIVEHFKVKKAWTNNEPVGSKGYRLFTNALDRRQVNHPRYDPSALSRTINGVSLEFLYPERDFMLHRAAEPWRNVNNNSLVVKATYGKHAFLFPGDIEVEGENKLLELGSGTLQSTVLLAPHHGSRSSSSGAFVRQVDPAIVVISAGWHNRFKFPHAGVLRRYRRQGSQIYRTDLGGAVRLKSDGNMLEVRPTVARDGT